MEEKNFIEKRLFLKAELHKKVKIIATLNKDTQESLINNILEEWMDKNYAKIVDEKL
jgi:hypothetical protein